MFAEMNIPTEYVVYSKTNCPQCDKLKGKLNALGIKYTEVKVDAPGNERFREFLLREGHRSVPQVYVTHDPAIPGKHVPVEEIISRSA